MKNKSAKVTWFVHRCNYYGMPFGTYSKFVPPIILDTPHSLLCFFFGFESKKTIVCISNRISCHRFDKIIKPQHHDMMYQWTCRCANRQFTINEPHTNRKINQFLICTYSFKDSAESLFCYMFVTLPLVDNKIIIQVPAIIEIVL